MWLFRFAPGSDAKLPEKRGARRGLSTPERSDPAVCFSIFCADLRFQRCNDAQSGRFLKAKFFLASPRLRATEPIGYGLNESVCRLSAKHLP